ncbi:hypothetical protein GCM10020331_068780 [Ectobacillus funiculus]
MHLMRRSVKNPIALLNQYLRDGEQETKIEQLIERHGMLKTNFLREKEQAAYMAEKNGSSRLILRVKQVLLI